MVYLSGAGLPKKTDVVVLVIIPEWNIWVQSGIGFYGPDALPVTQPISLVPNVIP